MALTFDELVTPATKDEQLQALLDALPEDFHATSWREGDVGRTILEIDAQALAEETVVRTQIAKGGLLETAEDDWLTLLAAQMYGIARNTAQVAARNVTLTAAAEAGPYSISPGTLWLSADTGLRYLAANDALVTLDRGGTLALTISAEAPGTLYNSAPATLLATPLPGVTVADDGIATSGVDEEADAALRSRCRARWAELGSGSPAAAYKLWATTASASVTRAKVVASGTVAGGVDVYLAGPAGGVASDVVTTVATYITARAPLGSTPSVVSATAAAQTLTATLYGKAQYAATAVEAAKEAFRALLQATEIGATIYGAAKIEALMTPEGVENAVISVGGGDTALSSTQVATEGTLTVNWSNT